MSSNFVALHFSAFIPLLFSKIAGKITIFANFFFFKKMNRLRNTAKTFVNFATWRKSLPSWITPFQIIYFPDFWPHSPPPSPRSSYPFGSGLAVHSILFLASLCSSVVFFFAVFLELVLLVFVSVLLLSSLSLQPDVGLLVTCVHPRAVNYRPLGGPKGKKKIWGGAKIGIF